MVGDFNDVLMEQDKFGGRPVNPKHLSLLWKHISDCNLIDIELKGCKFTWSNHKKKSKGLIMECLDRVFVNGN